APPWSACADGSPGSAGCASPARPPPHRSAALRLARIVTVNNESGQLWEPDGGLAVTNGEDWVSVSRRRTVLPAPPAGPEPPPPAPRLLPSTGVRTLPDAAPNHPRRPC